MRTYRFPANTQQPAELRRKQIIDSYYPPSRYFQLINLEDEVKYLKLFIFEVTTNKRLTDAEQQNQAPITEKAKIIHDRFIELFMTYNRKWNNYAGWLAFLGPIKKKAHYILINFIVLPSMGLNTILLYLCVYLFQDYSPTSNHQSLPVKFGFLLLYVFLLSYIVCYMFGISHLCLRKVFNSTKLELFFDWKDMFPDIIVETGFIGGFFSLILWNLKAMNYSEIPWTTVSIPGWITGVIVVYEFYVYGTYVLRNEKSFVVGLICSGVAFLFVIGLIPLVTVGWAADHPGHQLSTYWQWMTIMYYPFALLLVIYAIGTISFLVYLYYLFFWCNKTMSFAPDRQVVVSPKTMKYKLLWYTIHAIHVIACSLSYIFLLILAWKENWISTFIVVKSLQPIGLIFLFLATLHASIVTGILSIVVEFM